MTSDLGWYDVNPDYSSYYQGDILRDVPFPSWPTSAPEHDASKWAIIRPKRRRPTATKDPASLNPLPVELEAHARSNVEDAFKDGRAEAVAAKIHMLPMMVLTRTCSLESSKNFVLVAPVKLVSQLEIRASEHEKQEKLGYLREQRILHHMYLPAFGSMEESIVDLLQITYMHKTFLPKDAVKDRLIARLSSKATSVLQRKLADHFGKKFGFDHTDTCQQSGQYRCSTCFYEGADAPRLSFNMNEVFGSCKGCGEQACYVKLPA